MGRRWFEVAARVVSAHPAPIIAALTFAATAFVMRFPQRDGRPGDTSLQGSRTPGSAPRQC
ncbi:hypothetical protein [Gordonia rhizosphera]|nr:hypothetical protein [Gordonia rhizosphera]